MSRDNIYGLLKVSLQVVREYGKFDKTTIENMIKEIDAEFDNNCDEKLTSTPCSSPIKKKQRLEVFS